MNDFGIHHKPDMHEARHVLKGAENKGREEIFEALFDSDNDSSGNILQAGLENGSLDIETDNTNNNSIVLADTNGNIVSLSELNTTSSSGNILQSGLINGSLDIGTDSTNNNTAVSADTNSTAASQTGSSILEKVVNGTMKIYDSSSVQSSNKASNTEAYNDGMYTVEFEDGQSFDFDINGAIDQLISKLESNQNVTSSSMEFFTDWSAEDIDTAASIMQEYISKNYSGYSIIAGSGSLTVMRNDALQTFKTIVGIESQKENTAGETKQTSSNETEEYNNSYASDFFNRFKLIKPRHRTEKSDEDKK